MPFAGKVDPTVDTVKLKVLVYSKGRVPVGYMPVKTGKSTWAATSMKKFGRRLPPGELVMRKVALPLRTMFALLPLVSFK